tara:strand:- start:5746 stop:6915 length:1170 start_codon:yes stop_codon:yes gene_type:complete
MKFYRTMILVFTLLTGFRTISAQDVNLSGEIFEYATYYISSFDIGTGATNVQIFRYEMSANQYPVSVRVKFRAHMVSPQLGITAPTTIIEIITDPFDLQAPLILDNRDISSVTTQIYDMASPPNPIILSGRVIESLDPLQADAILQSILASGRIAAGQYTFGVQIMSGETDDELASDSKTIIVQSPVSISLESPGGPLADTSNTLVYTTFPIFQWFAQSGTGFSTFIRVAEFVLGTHSSPEDAIEDQRVLPFDQTESWYQINNVNSFQYPLSGAYPLEEGKVYVWQIKKSIPTTAGEEDMLSAIYSFKIGVSGQLETTNTATNALLMALQQALGDDQFNSLFGQGNELQGFVPTGQLEINGVNVDEAGINYLLNQIISQNYVIQGITVE